MYKEHVRGAENSGLGIAASRANTNANPQRGPSADTPKKRPQRFAVRCSCASLCILQRDSIRPQPYYAPTTTPIAQRRDASLQSPAAAVAVEQHSSGSSLVNMEHCNARGLGGPASRLCGNRG